MDNVAQLPSRKLQNLINSIFEKIMLSLSLAALVAAVIIFLMALGWNDEYLGEQVGGVTGNIIASLGNSWRWTVIFPMLLLAIVYPIIALFQFDFQPFVVVYLGGIGGAIFFLLSLYFSTV